MLDLPVASLIAGLALLASCSSVESARGTQQPSPQRQHVVTLLHTNDLHGHIDSWQGWEGDLAGKRIGGADRLATAIAQVRAVRGRDNVLLLDAGDTIGDTLLAELTKGQAVLEVMRALRYDAMTLGNHEPDFGAEILRQYIAGSSFPVLAANVRSATTDELIARPSMIKDVAGVKVGVIGLAYPNTPWTTAKKNVAGLRFEADSAAIARRYVADLRSSGAALVVVLSHLGLAPDRDLAAAVDGIDVIVGGHSHNRMSQAMRVGRTYIVQAGAHGSDLGRLDLVLDRDGTVVEARRELITLDHARVPADPAMRELVQRLAAPHRGATTEMLGVATGTVARAQTLAGNEPRKRDEQSPADSLFADILRDETGSDIALLPGVGYGVAIPKGPVTASDLRNLVPHPTKVVTLTITGRQLRAILEQSVENTYTEDPLQKVGGIIQVSGVRFS
jgi:2',3'-cyclic-nucleotide 2'-phosphodiesterase (5'-nucleotidase family)